MTTATEESTKQRIRRVNRAVTKDVKVFSKLVRQFAKQLLPDQLVLFQKKLVFEVLRRVVLKTPVDTGRARGNWQVSIDTPANTEVPAADARVIFDEAINKLGQLGFGQVVWVSNNVDYIVFLEDGSSSQAPNGMVRLTLQEVATIFQ